MRPYIASGSRLPLLSKCLASAALPRIANLNTKADVGDALHLHMNERVALGIAESCRQERLDAIAEACELGEKDTSIFQARARHFEWTPPRGALTEVALCLYEGNRVETCSGGKGAYAVGMWAILPTQVDLLWAEPEPLYRDAAGFVRCPKGSVLWVDDLKSGKEVHVDPVERNLQLACETVLAAIWTGAELAMPAITFWGKGRGVWDTLPSPLSGPQLGRWLDALLLLVAAGRAQEAAWEAGEPLSYTTGLHCEWCDCSQGCPAKLGMLKAWVGAEALVPGELTLEQARSLAMVVSQIESFGGQAREALRRFADVHGSIDLAPGKAWGPYVELQSELDVDKVLPILAEEVGTELAAAAVTRKLSKSACDEAIGAAHAAQGIKRQKSAAMRRVMGKARAAGGLVDIAKTKYGVHPVAVETAVPVKSLADPTRVINAEEIDGDD